MWPSITNFLWPRLRPHLALLRLLAPRSWALALRSSARRSHISAVPMFTLQVYPNTKSFPAPEMSTDRQALLEQKRKRLQELKERRSGVGLVDATQPNLALGEVKVEVPGARTKVDFAVQVDLPPSHSQNPGVLLHSEDGLAPAKARDNAPAPPSFKVDKIVQTNFESVDDPKLTEVLEGGEPHKTLKSWTKPDVSENTPVAVPEPEILPAVQVELALREYLGHAGFQFSDLRLGKTAETPVETAAVAPFHVTKSLRAFLQRPVVATAYSKDHPGVFVAAYGARPAPNRRTKQSYSNLEILAALTGLAVLFNRSADAIVPEFFLQCTGQICTIMFDATNLFRVFAGLENGRVVMWDLSKAQPTQVAVLPTLQTTTVAFMGVRPQHKYTQHTSRIVLMTQLNTESAHSSGVLTVCANGVVNLWSPHFLAYPKIASVNLADHLADSKRVPFKVADALVMQKALRVAEHASHQNPPEYNFFGQTVVASKTGCIFKLANLRENAFVRTRLAHLPPLDGPYARAVNSVAELPYNASTRFLLSAHADWSLRLWDLESGALRHVLPTMTVVEKVVVRPGLRGQFITLSRFRPPKVGLAVEFWDIATTLLGPVLTVPTRDKLSGTALFGADGSELIVGYDDGEIDIFHVEDSLLARVHEKSADAADGIEKVLSTV